MENELKKTKGEPREPLVERYKEVWIRKIDCKMKHKHVLKTLDTEYQVITDSPNWCWHDFFDEVMPDCKIFKIRLILFKATEDGKTLVKEYK